MDKKEMKRQYMLMRLQDPNVPEWEKKEIRARLGIVSTASENDFLCKKGRELQKFVFSYFEEQTNRIRRDKRTQLPLSFFPENLRTVSYLILYDSIFEDDTFIYFFDKDADLEDINGLIAALEKINRTSDAALIKAVLCKRKYSDEDVEELQNHFDEISNELDIDIENFIKSNIKELVDLQNI